MPTATPNALTAPPECFTLLDVARLFARDQSFYETESDATGNRISLVLNRTIRALSYAEFGDDPERETIRDGILCRIGRATLDGAPASVGFRAAYEFAAKSFYMIRAAAESGHAIEGTAVAGVTADPTH